MWSANTTRLSNLPSPSVSSRRTMRCGFNSSCFCTGSFEPEDSATYSRPSSSNDATIGRSTSGGPAASSIEKPSGTFGSGGELGVGSAAKIVLETEIIVKQYARNRVRNVMPQLQRCITVVSLEYTLVAPAIQPLSSGIR